MHNCSDSFPCQTELQQFLISSFAGNLGNGDCEMVADFRKKTINADAMYKKGQKAFNPWELNRLIQKCWFVLRVKQGSLETMAKLYSTLYKMVYLFFK